MEEQKFKVIIVEDVKLELKGTEEIFRHEIPNAEVIGTAMTESEFWPLMEAQLPDLVLLDLGLGGSTTIGVDICKNIFKRYKGVRVLIFTGEILNEKLWVDVLNAGADGIILKTGELLTKTDVQAVMDGKKLVFNYPILEKIVDRFKKSVANDAKRQEAVISYDIDEYDERFLRHLALGYTKEMIANLKGMPFGVKSLEKRQNDLIGRLFPNGERVGVNATRLADLNAQFVEKKTGLIVRPTVGINYSKNDYRMKNVQMRDESGDNFIYGNPKRFHDGYFSLLAQVEAGFVNKSWADAFFVSASYSKTDKELQTGSVQNKVYGMAERNSDSWNISARDRKSTRLNSSHWNKSRMPSSA